MKQFPFHPINFKIFNSQLYSYAKLPGTKKGVHLTLDSWRKNRDVEGWKVKSEVATNGDEEDNFSEGVTKEVSLSKWPEPLTLKEYNKL